MLSRLAVFACSLLWAIDPEWMRTIITIANREGEGPQAVAARLGRPLENASNRVENRDGVAVMNVIGPIFRRGNMMTEVSSGTTSLELLARDFRTALDSPDVRAIVLNIDSPGGEANGINEFSAMVRDARGTKPIVAYVGGTGASAAYWIATACDEIVCDETALVGSIGTILAVPAPNATSAKDIEIVSSQSPYKRVDAATKEGRALYQKRVDENAAIFVANVARNRNVSEAKVLADFGKGAVLIAREALGVGMIDGLGSLEATIARLAGSTPRVADRRAAMARALDNIEALIDRGEITGDEIQGSQAAAESMAMPIQKRTEAKPMPAAAPAPMVLVCPDCGAENPTDATSCSECGCSLAGVEPTPPGEGPTPEERKVARALGLNPVQLARDSRASARRPRGVPAATKPMLTEEQRKIARVMGLNEDELARDLAQMPKGAA